MVTKYYNLKELFDEQLTRIDDEILSDIRELKVSFIDPHNGETPYYQITIYDFHGRTVVV